MLRPLLRVGAALALAALIAPAVPSAAPPPGIAYDEIVRVVVNATPPPPGNFQADLAALSSGQAVAASPTPAPKKRGISIGNIAGVLAGGGGAGDVAGAVAGNVISNAVENAVSNSLGAQFGALGAMARSFLTPHQMRYAYWNGWERVEDVTAQTATIRKCDAGQVIHLNLAAKTYAVYDPASEPTPTPAPAPPVGRGRAQRASGEPAQPGTAVASLTEATRPLGAVTMENVKTTGYDTATTFAMSQSTGSCRDGGATIETVQYLPAIVRPTVNSCPVRRAPIPTTAAEAVTPTASGGCRPTFTASRTGPTPPANRLALYSLVTFAAANAPTPAPGAAAGGVGFLTERGNLKTLGPADAGVFSVPPGFTKTGS
ncbi:MAG: hypothetical protein QOJ39_9 [Candidatus Eremiobacteraeota bacterium]|jgi:hypothetical protein|nr:hypothetical protein [Candidatus Eremiobacteraeota bacterium]